VGVKSSLASTLRPWIVELSVPHGPMRLGPMRRFMAAMIFSSIKMITKAAGTVKSRIPRMAATKRRISMLAWPVSMIQLVIHGPTPVVHSTISPTMPMIIIAMIGSRILPPRLRRFQGLVAALTCRSRP